MSSLAVPCGDAYRVGGARPRRRLEHHDWSLWLRKAHEHQFPVIYFRGVTQGRYHALVPTLISGWDPVSLKARISFGLSERDNLSSPPQTAERHYAFRVVKKRLHQDSFQEAVITAYSGRIAFSGLRERRTSFPTMTNCWANRSFYTVRRCPRSTMPRSTPT